VPGTPGGVSGYEQVTSEEFFIPVDGGGRYFVLCPEGKVATGGGYRYRFGEVDLEQSTPARIEDQTGWVVDVRNASTDTAQPLTVWAVCVDAAAS
jgi:hypothetical protein